MSARRHTLPELPSHYSSIWSHPSIKSIWAEPSLSPIPQSPDSSRQAPPTTPTPIRPWPLHTPPAQDKLPPTPTPPPSQSFPLYVYRVTSTASKTRYSRTEGFRARNTSTILNTSEAVKRFATAHLQRATNISSPFISVYDSEAHAERVAHYLAQRDGCEMVIVTICTQRLGRGPVIRAADYLQYTKMTVERSEFEMLHRGEYLLQYTIPPEAIVAERRVPL